LGEGGEGDGEGLDEVGGEDEAVEASEPSDRYREKLQFIILFIDISIYFLVFAFFSIFVSIAFILFIYLLFI
jgi:hypothetical protein